MLEVIAENPKAISVPQIQGLRNLRIRRVAMFPKPYRDAFSFGWDWLNFNHPATQGLLRLAALTRIATMRRKLSPAQIGKLSDEWLKLPQFQAGLLATKFNLEAASTAIQRVQAMLSAARMIDARTMQFPTPFPQDVVPGTLATEEKGNWSWIFRNAKKKFGMPLTQ